MLRRPLCAVYACFLKRISACSFDAMLENKPVERPLAIEYCLERTAAQGKRDGNGIGGSIRAVSPNIVLAGKDISIHSAVAIVEIVGIIPRKINAAICFILAHNREMYRGNRAVIEGCIREIPLSSRLQRALSPTHYSNHNSHAHPHCQSYNPCPTGVLLRFFSAALQ